MKKIEQIVDYGIPMGCPDTQHCHDKWKFKMAGIYEAISQLIEAHNSRVAKEQSNSEAIEEGWGECEHVYGFQDDAFMEKPFKADVGDWLWDHCPNCGKRLREGE